MSEEDFDPLPDEDFNELLPAWFTLRMMVDTWFFGLLTDTGVTICIQRIDRIYQAKDGAVWIDVELMEGEQSFWTKKIVRPFLAPTSRLEASINTQHIVAAFELADT